VNLRDLKDRIFQMTGGIYRDQEHMRVLANQALTELAKAAKIQSSTNITLTPGVGEYPLPVDFKEAYALIEGSPDHPKMVWRLVDPESPIGGYAIYGGNLVIKPTPSDPKTLMLLYYAYPPELVSDDDELPIDDRYAYAVAAYAAAMIMSLPGMEGVSQGMIDRYFRLFEDAKARFVADMQRRNKRTTVRKVVDWWV
jgi:hypothetical protein